MTSSVVTITEDGASVSAVDSGCERRMVVGAGGSSDRSSSWHSESGEQSKTVASGLAVSV